MEGLRAAQQHRIDLLDALIRVQDDLPGFVAAVAASADTTGAQAAVGERFGLSLELADAVLDLSVRRMSQRERAKVRDERDALLRSLADS